MLSILHLRSRRIRLALQQIIAISLLGLGSAANSAEVDHAAALAQYDRAIAQGNAKPAILYNRAITLFKLERAEEAKRAFEVLLGDPQWGALARYNLGLIAEHQNRQRDALHWYQQVLTTTDNARLTTIAEQKIAQLTPSTTKSSPSTAKSNPSAAKNHSLRSAGKKSLVLVSMGAVVDDNATGLAEELSGSTSNARDVYARSLFYGHAYWSETKLYALLQTRHFQKFEHFNTRVLGAGAEWQTSKQPWRWQYGLRVLDIQVDEGELAKQFTGNIGSQKHWHNQRLTWRYNLSHFAAAQDYRHLQGVQHQLQLFWQKKWDTFALEPALIWEYNDREDKRGANTFFSYSPQILTYQLQASWQVTNKWQIRSGAEFAQAEYSANNRLTDIGGINKDQTRTYDRTTFSLGTRYQLHKHWQINLDYQAQNHDDRFALYSYSKNTIGAKIDFTW